MLYSGVFKIKIKFDDILFFIIIGLIVFVALWLLYGSPTLDSAVVSVGVFTATSELMLWRKYFDMDKKTAVSFIKMKNDVENLNKGQKEMSKKLDNVDKKLNHMDKKLNSIEKLIKSKI